MSHFEAALPLRKFDVHAAPSAGIRLPSSGVSADSQAVVRQLSEIVRDRYTRFEQVTAIHNTASLEERLFETLASLKVHTATVAMHLEGDWRARLFSQLDNLLTSEDWVADDLPPRLGSFATFLRIILFLKPQVRPGLAATSDGNLIASWTRGPDRLTLECLPGDKVRWIVSRNYEGETESAAGRSDISRLAEILAPYSPKNWFQNA